MNVSLVMFTAEGDRRDFPLQSSSTVIGRKNTCDLRIPLPNVSRQHCEIRIDDQKAWIRDLGSSNGTYHNNTPVEQVELAPGDELVIGPVVFTVVIDGKPEKLDPVRTVLSDVEGSGPRTVTRGEGAPAQSASPAPPQPEVSADDDENEDAIAEVLLEDDEEDDDMPELTDLTGDDEDEQTSGG